MNNQTILNLEKRLDNIANYAPYIHCVGFVSILIIGYLKLPHYASILQAIAFLFLITTLIINKTYIYTGKALETYKKFTPEEANFRKKEYFTKFFPPILFWTGCLVVVCL